MSIINEKYKGKKFAKDWLAELLDKTATKTRTVNVRKPDPEDAEKTVLVPEERAGGVDTDKLFALAKENGIENAKLNAARGTGKDGADPHGFAGRARMTLRNELQTVAKQRHGLVVNGEFVEAPADWLTAKSAPEAPTHTKAGEKIAPPKAAAADAEAAAA